MKHRKRPASNGLIERTGRVAATVVLLAALAPGCMPPLAHQDEYFSSTSRSIANANAEALGTVRHHRALQAVKHACPRPARFAPASGRGVEFPSGRDIASPPERTALATLCASTDAQSRPVSAHGATSNAYRRWVEDEVRELPDPSETAASAGGG